MRLADFKARSLLSPIEKFKNHYADALRELIASKVKKGGSVAVDNSEASESGKVIDFMEALKKSVGTAQPSTAKEPSKVARKSVSKKAKG